MLKKRRGYRNKMADRKEAICGWPLAWLPWGFPVAHTGTGLKVSYHISWAKCVPRNPSSKASVSLLSHLTTLEGWSTWGQMHSPWGSYKMDRMPIDKDTGTYLPLRSQSFLVLTTSWVQLLQENLQWKRRYVKWLWVTEMLWRTQFLLFQTSGQLELWIL